MAVNSRQESDGLPSYSVKPNQKSTTVVAAMGCRAGEASAFFFKFNNEDGKKHDTNLPYKVVAGS